MQTGKWKWESWSQVLMMEITRGNWVLNRLDMQTGHCDAILEHYSSFSQKVLHFVYRELYIFICINYCTVAPNDKFMFIELCENS